MKHLSTRHKLPEGVHIKGLLTMDPAQFYVVHNKISLKDFELYLSDRNRANRYFAYVETLKGDA